MPNTIDPNLAFNACSIPDASSLDVWVIDLDQSEQLMPRLYQMLDTAETAQAQRIKNPLDRRYYIAAHGALRVVLATYVQCAPDALRFTVNSFGKPAVSISNQPIGFNLTHSDGTALLAVSNGRDVGIDVERRRPIADGSNIAGKFFTAREQEALQELPSDRRDDAFLTCWTLKEAYLKAVGKGLSLPLDSFDAASFLKCSSDGSAVPSHVSGAGNWHAYVLPADPSHISAIVTSGQTTKIHMQRLILSAGDRGKVVPAAIKMAL